MGESSGDPHRLGQGSVVRVKPTSPPRLLEKPLLPNLQQHQVQPETYHREAEHLRELGVINNRLYRELIRKEWDLDCQA